MLGLLCAEKNLNAKLDGLTTMNEQELLERFALELSRRDAEIERLNSEELIRLLKEAK
jgi:hypothetical protein